MALICGFNESQSERRKLDPTTVTCDWMAFNTGRGPILQLSTMGSATRQNPGKPSQKVQLDREGAANLVNLIAQTFPGLVPDGGR